MALIRPVVRSLLSVFIGIFRKLLNREPGSNSNTVKIKKSSDTQVPVRISRTPIIEVEFQNRASDVCVPYFGKDQDGRPVGILVHDRAKNPGFWRSLPYIASDLATKLPCEKVKWILISYRLDRRGEFSFDVWEASLARDEDGSLRVSWAEVRPEHATEWIRRVEPTINLAARIRIRPSAPKGKIRAA